MATTDLAVGGRDLAEVATRRTAGERFSEADYELMLDGVATNTRLAIRRQWKRVLAWTGEHGYMECPMPVETCVKWIEAQWRMEGRYSRPGRPRPIAPSTVQQSLWVITKAHEVAMRPDGIRGYVTPVRSEEVQRAMRGYRKRYIKAGFRPDIATPIDPDEQQDMVRTCDTRSVIGLRDALALALLYDAGFRAGELVRTDEEHPGVLFEDVEIHVGGEPVVDWTRPETIELDAGDETRLADHLVIHVPMSKTDQEGDGDEVILGAHAPEYAFNCPVRLFLAWRALLREREFELRGPVLKQIFHGGKAPADGRPKRGTVVDVGLAYDGLVRIFDRAVEAAGLDNPEGRRRHFVLHGMRAGSATASAERGADTPEMNRHFRWSQRGNTAQRYAARGRKRRLNPVRRIWVLAA